MFPNTKNPKVMYGKAFVQINGISKDLVTARPITDPKRVLEKIIPSCLNIYFHVYMKIFSFIIYLVFCVCSQTCRRSQTCRSS